MSARIFCKSFREGAARSLGLPFFLALSLLSAVNFLAPPAQAETLPGAATPTPSTTPQAVPRRILETPPLTEIIVRGSALEDPLLSLPASSIVVSPREAEGRAAEHFQDVLDTVPNLNWAAGSSRPTFFQIRGIGEVEQYEGAPNPSVGFFVDDIDLSSLGGSTSMFDIEQTEVIRGPQAIRYGANALAGAISMRSYDPMPFFTSRAQISFGSDDLISGGAAVGGPLDGSNGKVQFRVSAFEHQSDGFRNNVFLSTDDTNNRDELTTRAKLRWLAAPDLTIDLSGLLLRFNNGYDAFSIDNSLTTQSDKPGSDAQNTEAGAGKITWGLSDGLEAISLTSYLKTSTDYSYDGDWGNDAFWGANAPYDYFSSTDRDRRLFSQELRLRTAEDKYIHGRTTRWVAGLYFQHLAEESEIRNYFAGDVYDLLLSDYTAKTGAAFGEYEIPLDNASALRIGGRLEQRTTTFEDSRGNDESPDDLMWGGSLTVDREVDQALRAYIALSRGFKGGGVNSSIGIPEDSRTFSPEALYNLELGLKGEFFERTLTSSTTFFGGLRRDVQTKLSYQSDPNDPLTFAYITDNAARGWNIGAEQEISYQATSQLTIRLAGSLLATRYTSVSDDNQSLDGREQSQSPHWQYFTSVRYDLTDSLYARVDLTGKDAYYFQDSHDERSTPYHLLGASVGYHRPGWSWTVWGRNLAGENYATRGFYFGNEPPDFPTKLYLQRGDPRQVGTTVSIYF
jgi:iron complex outermembrane receptor protein